MKLLESDPANQRGVGKVLTAEFAGRLLNVTASLPDSTRLDDLVSYTVKKGKKIDHQVLEWHKLFSSLTTQEKGQLIDIFNAFGRENLHRVEELRSLPDIDRVLGLRRVGETRYKFVKALFPTPKA